MGRWTLCEGILVKRLSPTSTALLHESPGLGPPEDPFFNEGRTGQGVVIKGMKIVRVSNEVNELIVVLEPNELQPIDDAIANTKLGNQIRKVTMITFLAAEMAME